MVCPKCGADIKENKIYCSVCGYEIHMVPDYIPEEDISFKPVGITQALPDALKDIPVKQEEPLDVPEEEIQEKPPRRHWKRYVLLALVLIGIAVTSSIMIWRLHELEQEELAIVVNLLEKPQFSLDPGTYEYAPHLALTHPQEGNGAIYYTVDGSTPDQDSIRYEKPVDLAEGETIIRAVFIREDGQISEEANGTYEVIFNTPEEPLFSEESGNYDQELSLVISSIEGVPIYYTTNGAEPDEQSELYTEPIRIGAGQTLVQAICIDENGNRSAIVEAVFQVTLPPPPPAPVEAAEPEPEYIEPEPEYVPDNGE